MDGLSQIVKILFLAANPNGTARRRLDDARRRIELALDAHVGYVLASFTLSKAQRNRGVARLTLYPRSNIATYW